MAIYDTDELSTQWEDALNSYTGTTIAPGTISPVGTTVGGKKQLSWPEVVKKLQENTAFKSSEYPPTQLAGVNTNDIYKAGAKSGMLPAGLATFTKSPFSSFASRTAANPYTPKSSSATEAAAVAAQTQLTPVSGNVQRQQQPEESWTQGDLDKAALDAYSPSTLPGNITFMPSISGMLGQMGSAIMDTLSGKTQTYNDLTTATPEQVENLYNNNEFGDISTKDGRAKADSIVESWRNGQMIWDGNYNTSNVDLTTGKGYTPSIYDDYRDQSEGPIDKAVNKYLSDPFRKLIGDDLYMGNQEKYAGKQGYVRDGSGGYVYVDKFGNVSAGNRADFESQERARQENRATSAGFDSYADQVQAQFALDQGRGYTNPDGTTVQGGYRHFDKQITDNMRDARYYNDGMIAQGLTPGFDYGDVQYRSPVADPSVRIQGGTEYGPTLNTTGRGAVSRAGYVLDGPDEGGYVGDQFSTLDNTATEQSTASAYSDSEDYDSDDVASDYSGAGLDDVGYYNSGGRVAMQEGGPAPQMPMPQQPQAQAQAQPQGVQGDIENLGMINEQAAAQPQNGGQQSVKDDIPREADAGDYILPYETVLLTGLNQLNRYAREAVKLAMENDINLKGTDIDPTDDVPIKVSNYEYHIPKMLVPFFGGGKKYLDKIREEGLALRKRLEEEKQPSMQEQQPMEQKAAPAPQPQMVADAQPQAPQMPMMQEGGFVEDPTKAIKSAEQALTSDSSQPTQSAYNQVQALERSRIQKQQPPMVDPTGRVVQQGFAAPQGYDKGGTVSDEELAADRNILNELDPADLFALVMKSEIRDDENSEEQAKHFGSMVMNRVRNGSFGGKDLKQVLLKENQFAGINFKKDKNHRANFERAIRGTKVDDPYFLKYKAIANQLINRKLPDPTNGALFVLNKKGYAKEQGLPEGSLPEYLTDVMETTQIGDLSYFNKGPLPTKKPPPPNLPAIEKAYNKGGFIEAAA